MSKECEVRENCRNYLQGKCWYCADYSLYWPEDKKILCKRQIRKREERKLSKKIQKESEASKRGKRSKKKGYEGEKEIEELLNRNGIEAERVPLSGALKTQKYSCDVHLSKLDKRAEVKRRKSGMKTLQKWLDEDENSSYVFFREDGNREGWIVSMKMQEFIHLANIVQKYYQRLKEGDS